MKKLNTFILSALLIGSMGAISASAQTSDNRADEASLTFTTAKAVGEKIKLFVYAIEGDLWIDLNGDGSFQAGEELKKGEDIEIVLPAQTLTIYGNLNRFFCPNNEITEIDFSKATELGYIDCGSNLLTKVELKNVPKLYGFECYNNKLKTLDLSQCPNLDWLSVFCNQIDNDGMTALIESLHVPENESILKPYSPMPWNEIEETNTCTPEHVAMATAKKWTVLDPMGLPFPGVVALNEITAQEAQVKISYEKGQIVLNGLTAKMPIELYGIDGRKHFVGKAKSDQERVALGSGCYLVRVGKRVLKAVL